MSFILRSSKFVMKSKKKKKYKTQRTAKTHHHITEFVKIKKMKIPCYYYKRNFFCLFCARRMTNRSLAEYSIFLLLMMENGLMRACGHLYLCCWRHISSTKHVPITRMCDTNIIYTWHYGPLNGEPIFVALVEWCVNVLLLPAMPLLCFAFGSTLFSAHIRILWTK